jgi:hypothetical protein
MSDNEQQNFFKEQPTEPEAVLTMLQVLSGAGVTDVVHWCGQEHKQLHRMRAGLGDGLSEEDYEIQLLDLGKVLKVRFLFLQLAHFSSELHALL